MELMMKIMCEMEEKQQAIKELEKEFKRLLYAAKRLSKKPESKSKKIASKRIIKAISLGFQIVACGNQISLILSQPYAPKLPPLETVRD
jgi:hypothetical protein